MKTINEMIINLLSSFCECGNKHSLVNSYFCGYKCLVDRFIAVYNIKIEKIKKVKK